MHSQRLRETPLKPWIIAERSGKVLAGHCDCIAGIGETCTHVSALMFYIDTKVRIRESKTVTQEPAYWKLPASVKEAAYLPASKIDFTSAKTKKKQLDVLVDGPVNTADGGDVKQRCQVPTPTDDELDLFYKELNEADTKPAILTVLPNYSHQFHPEGSNFPTVLPGLYDSENCELPFPDLLKNAVKCLFPSAKIRQTMWRRPHACSPAARSGINFELAASQHQK